MSKLSNTSAITEALKPGHFSRDVRKIAGGHLVRESSYSEDCGPVSHERFIPAGEKSGGPSALADAMRTAKGGR